MMRPLIVTSGLLLVLAGCAAPGFARNGAAAQNFHKDIQECDRQHSAQNNSKDMCMQERGWIVTRDKNAFRE